MLKKILNLFIALSLIISSTNIVALAGVQSEYSIDEINQVLETEDMEGKETEVEEVESEGTESEEVESEGTESEGTESEKVESEGTESEEVESEGTESEEVESEGTESEEVESEGTESEEVESEGTESEEVESEGTESEEVESEDTDIEAFNLDDDILDENKIYEPKSIININKGWSFTKQGKTTLVNLPHSWEYTHPTMSYIPQMNQMTATYEKSY
ncbi:hypothetical protein [Turicibacter sp. H121]|uniref:hypothetical protein n=1 Tax=Turicibacter sp. H121 TaxID=1712675 RepID=UPI000763123A|nr:hypothetical protein [Turicibacter sp. H121]AMC08062.1 hypothetical protein AT726_03260 [Turicibacter sp. H121]